MCASFSCRHTPLFPWIVVVVVFVVRLTFWLEQLFFFRCQGCKSFESKYSFSSPRAQVKLEKPICLVGLVAPVAPLAPVAIRHTPGDWKSFQSCCFIKLSRSGNSAMAVLDICYGLKSLEGKNWTYFLHYYQQNVRLCAPKTSNCGSVKAQTETKLHWPDSST